MATLNVSYSRVRTAPGTGTVVLDASDPGSFKAETLTTSTGSSVAGGITTSGQVLARVTATGADHYVTFGVTPVAAASNGVLIINGSTEYFLIADGVKIAALSLA